LALSLFRSGLGCRAGCRRGVLQKKLIRRKGELILAIGKHSVASIVIRLRKCCHLVRFPFRCMSHKLLSKIAAPLLSAMLLVLPVALHAADAIGTAEAAVEHFHAACDGEIAKAAAPEKLKAIRAMRESPFLMIALKSHVDVTEFLDPQFASAIEKNGLYGSRAALTQSTGNVWVLTYGNMRSMVAYVDATNGAVLCIAVIPEG
jgi:hypothetical protein